jgi:hypothetical protein
MKQVTTMSELVTDLSTVYSQVRERSIASDEAKDIANVAGKLIKAATSQLKYQEFIDDKTPIGFFKNIAPENKTS